MKNNGKRFLAFILAFAIVQLLSNIRYFELKKPKTGMPKRQMLSICQKEGYSVAELTDIQNELR